jgi:hypothetical protein
MIPRDLQVKSGPLPRLTSSIPFGIARNSEHVKNCVVKRYSYNEIPDSPRATLGVPQRRRGGFEVGASFVSDSSGIRRFNSAYLCCVFVARLSQGGQVGFVFIAGLRGVLLRPVISSTSSMFWSQSSFFAARCSLCRDLGMNRNSLCGASALLSLALCGLLGSCHCHPPSD